MNIHTTMLTCICLLLSSTGYSQKLQVEAFYYDENNQIYRVERKYINEKDSTLYYALYSEKSVLCIKRKERHNGNISILEENYCTLKIGGLTDRKWLSHMQDKSYGAELDTMRLSEKIKTYYKNGLPAKVEIYNGKEELYNTSIYTYSQRGVVIKESSKNKTGKMELFKKDTLTWNADTSIIKWTIAHDGIGNFKSQHSIKGTEMISRSHDTVSVESHFVDNYNLRQLLLSSIYSEQIYNIALHIFDRVKIVTRTTFWNKRTDKSEYVRDDQNRITQQTQFINNQPNGKVLYRYY